MKTDDKYSRENRYICEYDNYPIPPYDPTIPPDERARLMNEAEQELDKLLKELTKA